MADNVSKGVIEGKLLRTWCKGREACTAHPEADPDVLVPHEHVYWAAIEVPVAVAPGADTGVAGGGGGLTGTSEAQTVVISGRTLAVGDVERFVEEVLCSEREMASQLEQERRESARLREELQRAKDSEAEALVRAGEAAERAWEYSMRLDVLRPAVLMRNLLEKNERTIKGLRAELKRLRPYRQAFRAKSGFTIGGELFFAESCARVRK